MHIDVAYLLCIWLTPTMSKGVIIFCFQDSLNSLRPSDTYMRQRCNHHWFRQWLVAWSAPSHYLNQCSNIVNWTLRNNLQWNLNRISFIFIQENVFENVVCKMAIISSRPQCVNKANTSLNPQVCSFTRHTYNFLGIYRLHGNYLQLCIIQIVHIPDEK